jgi:hypothetical protein
MALTVPPPTSSFSEFGWIFHNNHLDSSIYQDDDIMEFSDSSGEYQTSPPQNTQQQPSQVSLLVCKSIVIALVVCPEKIRDDDDVPNSLSRLITRAQPFQIPENSAFRYIKPT